MCFQTLYRRKKHRMPMHELRLGFCVSAFYPDGSVSSARATSSFMALRIGPIPWPVHRICCSSNLLVINAVEIAERAKLAGRTTDIHQRVSPEKVVEEFL